MKNFNKNSVSVMFVVLFMLGLMGPVAVSAAGPAVVNLGSAGNYVILAKTGISTTGSTSVVGDMGVSPAAATYITGFALVLPSASPFSTSALVTGKIYAPGYANPTPTNLTTAVSNMETAYTDGAGRTNPTATELGAGNIGGLTITPGLYKWGTGVVVPSNLTLSGGANDVWIFQIGQYLNVSSGVKVILTGGAQASNVFWIVAGQTTIGTTAVFNGNILDQTAIVLNTGARLNGRALAQTAVTLDSSAVAIPSGVVSVMPVTPVVPVVTTTPDTTAVVTPAQTVNTTSVPSTTITVTPNQTVTTVNNTTTTTSAPVSQASIKSLAINLIEGSRSSYVTTLQQFLISQNKGPASVALSQVGPTSYFGAMTRAALAEFQASVGISPALGNFGPITREYLRVNY